MPRIMTIWLPRWPVQRRLRERPEWRKVPVFVCRRERRGVMNVTSWAWAEPPRDAGGRSRSGHGLRIPAGTSLAEAMALMALTHGSRACHVAEVVPDDPTGDRAALERLARWCRRFSPAVAIDTVDEAAVHESPDCIHLDVTGTAGFFGGESMLVRTAAWTLAARGLHARAAIADTPGAAWAAAHHTDLLASAGGPARPTGRRFRRPQRWAVVPAGDQATMLSGLPLAALRLDAATTAALGEVGIDSVGGVLKLSAKSLASRFPALLGRRRAQFIGTLAEPLAGNGDGDILPVATQVFELPVPTATLTDGMLEALLERLLAECLAPLSARGEGVLALQVRIEHPSGISLACPPTVIDIGLFRPSLSRRHLSELVRLRLGRLRLPREIDGIAVEVVAAAAAACRQRSLFANDGDASGGANAADQAVAVDMLLDRLAGRLGRDAVFEPRPAADAQPEHAWIASPPAVQSRSCGSGRTRPGGHARSTPRAAVEASAPQAQAPLRLAGRRPLWMPARPLRIEPLQADLVAVAAHDSTPPRQPPLRFRLQGHVHRTAQAHGPERIETAWWRGPIVRRDYYVVETEAGARLWLFRRLKDGAWFLHGVFA